MKSIPRFIPSLTIGELFSVLKSKQKKTNNQNELTVFAEQFAKYIGVSYAIPAPSGRAALAGLIEALGLPKEGEVILPSLTFHAIPLIFKEYGLKPHFVDINPNTYCMDTNCLEKAINPSTVAIMPVHLYGRACNMNVIVKIAKQYDLIVIEDCAQSCGGYHNKRRLGSFGQGAIFSFHPHKNFLCLESGMVVTNSKEVAVKLKSFMEQFSSTNQFSLFKKLFYIVKMRAITRAWVWNFFVGPILRFCSCIGFDPIELLTNETPKENIGIKQGNLFMPGELHGRIGISQLKKIDKLNQKCIDNGNRLWEKLQNISGIEVPERALDGENVYMSFVIGVKNKKVFRHRLRYLGVDTHGGNMFVGPYLPGMEGKELATVAFDKIKHMVHLPIYPTMTYEEIDRIAAAITKAVVDQRY